MSAKKHYTVSYIYRSAGKTFAGRTVCQGDTRTEALNAFTREHPHIISARIVEPAAQPTFTSGHTSQGETGPATDSSPVAAPIRLTAAQHNAFPKGRWS